jgi:hypothetical protein
MLFLEYSLSHPVNVAQIRKNQNIGQLNLDNFPPPPVLEIAMYTVVGGPWKVI